MMTIQAIRDALRDRRIGMVAAGTGLHYNTIKRLRDNPAANPSYKVLAALTDYLSGEKQNGGSDRHTG
tara:strand:+ start:184 stop:387 length:204 start_codon:yes stop_codon:yes gene_type:complete